ncbi:MAG: hypothetical protein WD894_07550 [Pirellulales bacterium]
MSRIALTWSCAALGLAAFVGCGDTKQTADKDGKSPPTKQQAKQHEHEHEHEGPHGGHVIELGGGGYHAELTHDDQTKVFGVYLLDGDAKKPITSEDKELVVNLTVAGEPQQYTLTAAPQAGDPEGQSSRYELKDEKLVEAWDAPKTKGRLRINLGGKSYAGDIDAAEHAHE